MGANKGPSARADLKNNRLYITVSGRLNKKELDGLYTDIRFCVADLQPGFAVITDLSQCTLAALSGLSTFKKITDHLIGNKVGKVIRIVDERRIVFKQILNVTALMEGYTPVYVKSHEEAEEMLSKF
ncbi:MAG: hypothetical protein QNJ17_02505 [Desulfocapsaceae bacterium]|nr:hypothetical protein [Desulfocapsaceae bacterium]